MTVCVGVADIATGDLVTVEVNPSGTVEDLKKAIATELSVEIKGMRIIWNNKLAKDSDYLEKIGIVKDCVVNVYIKNSMMCETTYQPPPLRYEATTKEDPVIRRVMEYFRKSYLMEECQEMDEEFGELYSEFEKCTALLYSKGVSQACEMLYRGQVSADQSRADELLARFSHSR